MPLTAKPDGSQPGGFKKTGRKNYDKVVARKKAKLEELKQTARDKSKITEMQEIVDEMLKDRENRVNQTLSRFTDERLRPDARTAADGYLPVLGAAQNVYIAYTPVTNAQYAVFIQATGRPAPQNWPGGAVPAGEENFPVVYVSYQDALAYCKWLSKKTEQPYTACPPNKNGNWPPGICPKMRI